MFMHGIYDQQSFEWERWEKIQQEKPKPLVSARWFLCASYLIFHRGARAVSLLNLVLQMRKFVSFLRIGSAFKNLPLLSSTIVNTSLSISWHLMHCPEHIMQVKEN